jgi:hypothetical protein
LAHLLGDKEEYARGAILTLEEYAAAAATAAEDLAETRRDLETRLGKEDEEDEENAALEDGMEWGGDFPEWKPSPLAAPDEGGADQIPEPLPLAKEEAEEGEGSKRSISPSSGPEGEQADSEAEVKEEESPPPAYSGPLAEGSSPRPRRGSLLSQGYSSRSGPGPLDGYSPFERYLEEPRGSREEPPEVLVTLPGPSYPTLVTLPGPSPREPPARVSAHAQALEPELETWAEPELTPRPSHKAGGRELTPEPPMDDGDFGPSEGQASPPPKTQRWGRSLNSP